MEILEHGTTDNRDIQFYPAEKKWDVSDIDDTDIEYPESDGEPMGETGFHVRATLRLYGELTQFFTDQPDVYVAADMFFYYEKGNPRANKAPDVMVIRGVGNHERRTFRTWEEKAVPCVIFEVTSKSTMIEDMVNKSRLYASLGVREYFLFDPLGEYIEKNLLGYRLKGTEYTPIHPDNQGRLFSRELNVILKPENDLLRVIDPESGKPVPSLHEAISQADMEARRADQEFKRAEEESKRAEQEFKRAEEEARRAEEEARRAEEEARRAEEESRRAEEEARRAEEESRRAEEESRRAEQERQNALRERQRSERLIAQLRAMGIEPEI